ncbi:MAG TPA: KEOPS complex subunit Pcc1 [Candidatus Thermoplasmatota archaeon]|nr:KEOPS complex subunit Pcc1 [Candidatus Thermoplasmatota archaeon]
MKCAATLRVPCGDARRAEALLASLAPENEGYVRARVEGDVLVLDAEASSPASLRRTLDDALACAAAGLGAARRAADEEV